MTNTANPSGSERLSASTRCHLWPFGAPLTDDSRCTECGVTWAGHYGAPECNPAVTQPGGGNATP